MYIWYYYISMSSLFCNALLELYTWCNSLDPAHDPVEGMIGMEVLGQFDVDFDFPAGRLRLWKPHTVERVAKKAGMSTIDAIVVNETLLLGFRVVSHLLRRMVIKYWHSHSWEW